MRRELEAELSDLELSCNSVDSADLLLRLEKARKDSKRLFLCLNGYGNKAERVGHIEVLSAAGSNEAFKRVAKAAGSDWPLRTHQCRRTYARCFVESRMGRTSLVFLKWQFKHSSMSMTQLYASNPLQDLTLFDEILQQMTEFKIDLIESWLDDQPLAGGRVRGSWSYVPFRSKIGVPCWPRQPPCKHSSDWSWLVHRDRTGLWWGWFV